MVGTVLRFADHLTGVCQELPEHVFPGSARVRTSYHLHPAQPILARATVVHPATSGPFKVPPPSRCWTTPAVREGAGGHIELGDMAVKEAIQFVHHQSEEGLPGA